MYLRKGKFFFSLLIITITIILSIPASQSVYTDNVFDLKDEGVIRVAIYDCSSSFNIKQFQAAFNYQWTQNNRTYRFYSTVIDEEDVLGYGPNPLTNENFDVFVIGASAKAYLFDGMNPDWKANVKKFVSNGGGYLGICGGANAASQGFENPENAFHRRVNKGVLGLANVYINDNFLGEWQYLLKIGFDAFFRENITNSSYPSYVSVNLSVEKNQDNAIFSTYDDNFRYIAYAGGPGMYNASKSDTKLGPIAPLLRYNEELMETKPIHYWRPTLDGWKIYKNVTTNLSGKFAGIATTYNSNGRVVLYGPHPEYPFVVINGTIEEYYGRGYMSSYALSKQYVYDYVGYLLNFSYNVWIVRRSVAWAAQIPEEDLPPISETVVWLSVNSNRLLEFVVPIHIGDVSLTTRTANNVEKVEFYIDNELKFVDYDAPYQWLWDERSFGKHSIEVVAYDTFGNLAYDSIEAWKIL